MLALETAINTRFKEIDFPDDVEVAGLFDIVPKKTQRPYCAKYQIPGQGTKATFRDVNDGSILTIEPYTLQFNLVVEGGRVQAYTLMEALDVAFRKTALNVNGCTIGVRRLMPIIVMELPADSSGCVLHQAVARFQFDFDNLIPGPPP